MNSSPKLSSQIKGRVIRKCNKGKLVYTPPLLHQSLTNHLNQTISSQCWIVMERPPNYRTAKILISNRKLQKFQFKVYLVYSLFSLFIDTKVLLLCSRMIRGTRTCKRKKKKWRRMSVPLSWKHTVISSSASLCRAKTPNLSQFRERLGCTITRKSRKKRLKTHKGRALVISSA